MENCNCVKELDIIDEEEPTTAISTFREEECIEEMVTLEEVDVVPIGGEEEIKRLLEASY